MIKLYMLEFPFMHRVVPELILENYRKSRFEGEFQAIGMFLDLSGFSRMTDELMQHGQHGAEVLARLMHGVFNPLVQSIFEYGGRIVSFAGDGLLVLYPVNNDPENIALRAMASAWVVQKQIQEDPDRLTTYGTFSFSVKIGMAMGDVRWRILRSADDRQATYYFRGRAVEHSAKAEHRAEAGDILISRDLAELLGKSIMVRSVGDHYQFEGFKGAMPGPSTYEPGLIDVDAASRFMPIDVITRDLRGEFRQIVNLFMRIPDLPDNELDGFIQSVFYLRDKYGGLLNRIDFGDKGCNLLMLWGAPIAFENDIARALNFIADLQQSMDFPITAGVTYYVAHAGYLGGEMCEDYTCYGWGVNLASRFMMTASPGDVWVDRRVAERVSHLFEFQSLGSQPFKGFASEQQVHLLKARQDDVSAQYSGKFIGRDDELRDLARMVSPIWDGKYAGVSVVWGDAGIGKGRLVHEFRQKQFFADQEVLWVDLQADQLVRTAFDPLRRWLIRYIGLHENQTADQKKAVFEFKLDSLLSSLKDPNLAQELEQYASILASLAELYWENSLYDRSDAEHRQRLIAPAVSALLKAECGNQPVIIYIDDAHLLDSDTLDLFLKLNRTFQKSNSEYPIAILLTVRKTGPELQLPQGMADHVLDVGGINPDAIRDLIREEIEGEPSIELVELIQARSEGNPFFAMQIARYLSSEDLLTTSKGRTQLKRSSNPSILPFDIRSLLVAILDQLNHDVRQVVQAASVLGREFDVNVLSNMLGSKFKVEDLTKDAEKASVLLPVGNNRYMFHHALLRESAYSMQMRARRQELHSLALQALENVAEGGDNEKQFAELAFHAERGENRPKAARYYHLAGMYAMEGFHNAQAIEYLSKALNFVPMDDISTRFDIVACRVEVYSRTGKRIEELNDIQSLEHWAGKLGEKDRTAKVMMFRAAYHYFIGEHRRAIEYAERSEMSDLINSDTSKALYTQVVWSTALLRLGLTEEAMQRARVALEQSKEAGDLAAESRILNLMGLVALESKTPELAFVYLPEALKIARTITHLELETKALGNLAVAEGSIHGNYELARDYYHQAYEIEQRLGDLAAMSTTLGNIGYAETVLGDLDSAHDYYEQGLRLAREIENRYQEEITLINLSYLACLKGDADRALTYAEKANRLSETLDDPSGAAWAHHYAGNGYLLRHDHESAIRSYKRSLEIREKLDQPILGMEPLAGLLESFLETGDIAQARNCAEKITAQIKAGSRFEGTDEPLRIFYNCYQYLAKINDERANEVLRLAKMILAENLSRLGSDVSRKRYIENAAWRLALHKLG